MDADPRALHSVPLEFRRATRAEREALRAMQALSFRALARPYYDAAAIEAFIARIGTMDDAMLDDGTYFLAFAGRSLVGCGGWSRRAPGYAAHIAAGTAALDTRAATVRSIYVHPAWSRRGIGRQVMDHIERNMVRAGFERAQLTATRPGIPLYLRLGYRPGAAVAIGLGDDGDLPCLTMDKPLAECSRD